MTATGRSLSLCLALAVLAGCDQDTPRRNLVVGPTPLLTPPPPIDVRDIDRRFDDRFWRQLVFNQYEDPVLRPGFLVLDATSPNVYIRMGDPTGRRVVSYQQRDHMQRAVPRLVSQLTGSAYRGRVESGIEDRTRLGWITVRFVTQEEEPEIAEAACGRLGLSLWASARVKRTFNRYSKVWSRRGSTGAQAAVALLRGAGITDVQIVRAHGVLSDHYNPVTKKLVLSEPVHASDSIAAVGMATHEAGHAIQHARHYAPLWVRSALVPTASIGSSLGYGAMAIGLFLASTNLVLVGAVLFSAVLLFQVVTLPVEFNASNRAKALTVEHEIITAQEREGVDRVLNAAALTYVAAAVSTLLTLLYFLWRAGLLGGRR